MKFNVVVNICFFLLLSMGNLFFSGEVFAGVKLDSQIFLQRPEQIEKINAPFEMVQPKRPQFPDKRFNVISYGAKNDGVTNNRESFQKAIDACSASGGGIVVVPKGKWFTGAIQLKSNVNLHLENGSELHFSTNPADYLPVVFTRWAGTELYNYSPLIYAENCENIAITGNGELYGHGDSWWHWYEAGEKTISKMYNTKVLKNILPEKRIAGTVESGLRPQFISPINCKNVLFEGFSIKSPGPFWTFDIIYCENVIVRGLSLETRGGVNTDGININSTKNALIEYCSLSTGDDVVCMKSGLNEDGRRVNIPTQNVVVRYIYANHGHGGVVIGSETSGGIKNIYAHDCYFENTGIGLRIKSNASRGGYVENIYYKNINIGFLYGAVVDIRTNYSAFMASKNGKAYPFIHDIHFDNIFCEYAGSSIYIEGTIHKPIENIFFENIDITSHNEMKFDFVKNVSFENMKLKSKDIKSVIPNILFTHSLEPGLKEEIFDNIELKGKPICTKVEENIAHDWWPTYPPAEGMSDDNFSIRWSGYLKIPEDAIYEIGMEADDGFRIYLDDKLILNEWDNNLCGYKGTKIKLEKNKYYNFKIEYYDKLGFGCSILKVRKSEEKNNL